METLDQGLATALVLLGIAAMLYGVATVYRSVAEAKVQQQELRLELDARARASERLREQAARHEERDALLLALIPAGAALVGHWLGRQSPRDDDDTIEIDLRSLLGGLGELVFDHWLATQLHDAKADSAVVDEHDHPEPTPGVAPGMS